MSRSPLRSPRDPRFDMNNYDMMLALGLKPGGHLPLNGMTSREIQGVTIFVRPAPPPSMFKNLGEYRKKKSSVHRVIAVCPECGKNIPFGRLAQHYKVHPICVEA